MKMNKTHAIRNKFDDIIITTIIMNCYYVRGNEKCITYDMLPLVKREFD